MSYNTNSEIGISSSGKLTIRGKGSLSVNDLAYTYNAIDGIDYLEVKETSITTSGLIGIQAKEKVTIENSRLKITGVKKGTKVKVYSTSGNWFEISLNENKYCSSNYLE